MEYVITRQDDELYHYGVKGMKWGVRRAIGRRAKVAATLERNKKTVDKQIAKTSERIKAYGNDAPVKLRAKNRQLKDYSAKMELYRNKAIKDISDKDIKQGRSWLMKAGIMNAVLFGAPGAGGTMIYDQVRANRYIKEQTKKKSNKETIDKGDFKGVNKENYKYYEEMLKSQGSDIRKYKPTEIDEQGRIVRMTLR